MKQVMCYARLLIFLMLVWFGAVHAEESPSVENPGAANELKGISVFGNRELPKSLVIVPWGPPESSDFDRPPLQSLVDEVLGPVDKEVHQRKTSYYGQYLLR